MLCSTTPAFRAKYLISVLQTYYNSFVNFLAQLNCPKPINFTFGSFLDEFNSNLLCGFAYMTFAIPLQLSTFSIGAEEPKPKDENADQLTPDEIFRAQFYRMVEKSPGALARLVELTEEMIRLQVL
jgi:hypothetical protein